VFLVSDELIKGIKAKTAIEPPIVRIPAVLCGIDRKIA
jgi:hypothetical protein